MITAPILYGSPFDAGLLSSKRPTHPSLVGTDAGSEWMLHGLKLRMRIRG